MWCVKLIWDQESIFYNIPEIGANNKIDLIFGLSKSGIMTYV